MRIPGFTGANALTRTKQTYHSDLHAALASGVLPQFCFTNEGGTICCQCYFGWCYCFHLIRLFAQ
jgi:hypothetical protein